MAIESESRFVLRFLVSLLKLPYTLLMVLFRRKNPSELTEPFRDFFSFLVQPKVTITLVVINVFIFFVEVFYLSETQLQALVFEPKDLLTFNVIPIVASWFLHASIVHLAGNMLFLYIFGRIVEMRFGSVRMLVVYFVSAIIADIASAMIGQGGIGASGAIAGLIAAAVLYDPFYVTYIAGFFPLPIIVIGWLAVMADVSGLLYGVQDGIGHAAHLGGYLAMSILFFIFGSEEKARLKLGLIVNIVFVLVGYVVFLYFRGF